MHTDFNTFHHSTYGKLDRRINLLIYMNKEWKPEYKGDLLMYHPDNFAEVKRTEPLFNRCVIMQTRSHTLHGYDKINFPKNVCRLRKH